MLYRQLFTIKDLSIQPSEWNRFELRGGSAEVVLEPFADAEAAAGVTLDITRAQVTLTAPDPKPQNRALLDELRNIRGPESIQEAHVALVAARTGADWRGPRRRIVLSWY